LGVIHLSEKCVTIFLMKNSNECSLCINALNVDFFYIENAN